MKPPSRSHGRLITKVCTLLREAEQPVRILERLAWPIEVRTAFLHRKAKRLPTVNYQPLPLRPVMATLKKARAEMESLEPWARSWLRSISRAVEGGARMLHHLGTPEFHLWSTALYGTPRTPLQDGRTTSLDLAHTLVSVFESLRGGAVERDVIGASSVARILRTRARKAFGDEAPQVVLVENLSANALAGPNAVRIRKRSHFTEMDVAQLIQHELMVHVATALNGRSQKNIPILAASNPATTRTQEGLAVFSEFMTGTMDPQRLHRLADRVLAIDMSMQGANFIEVYRFFLERTEDNPEQAFENTRRVFRGGVLTGGSPFTKDGVYLDGLLRVHNFVRSAISHGRADCLPYLFCGKLDIEHLPAIVRLAQQGLVTAPRYLPRWARDLSFLISYMGYSGFLNRIHLDKIQNHYAKLLDDVPLMGTHLIGKSERPSRSRRPGRR